MFKRRAHVDRMYGECHSHRPASMPFRFDPLAVYNAECLRGLVHTSEYAGRMAALQEQFDEWSRRVARLTAPEIVGK